MYEYAAGLAATISRHLSEHELTPLRPQQGSKDTCPSAQRLHDTFGFCFAGYWRNGGRCCWFPVWMADQIVINRTFTASSRCSSSSCSGIFPRSAAAMLSLTFAMLFSLWWFLYRASPSRAQRYASHATGRYGKRSMRFKVRPSRSGSLLWFVGFSYAAHFAG